MAFYTRGKRLQAFGVQGHLKKLSLDPITMQQSGPEPLKRAHAKGHDATQRLECSSFLGSTL